VLVYVSARPCRRQGFGQLITAFSWPGVGQALRVSPEQRRAGMCSAIRSHLAARIWKRRIRMATRQWADEIGGGSRKRTCWLPCSIFDPVT